VEVGDDLLRRPSWPAFEAPDELDGAGDGIEEEYRRRLAGLRRLPRRERSAALKAAREERMAALKQLRERRAIDRHARYMLWRSQMPQMKRP